jgi:hypothetical protein
MGGGGFPKLSPPFLALTHNVYRFLNIPLSPVSRELKNNDSKDETSILLHGTCHRHSSHALLKFARESLPFTPKN